MLTPQLFIGVGGSGGKTLRYLYRELERRLRAVPTWQTGMPAAWGFVHVDIPEEPDGFESDVPPGTLVSSDEYLGLARYGVQYEYYYQDITRHPNVQRAVSGWVPPNEVAFDRPWLGAKQVRALGRVITVAEIDEIGERLRQRTAELQQPDVSDELSRLAALMGTTAGGHPQVIIVGALGGGAGSGMLLDIIEYVCLVSTDDPVTILFTPEIFDHVTPIDRRRGIAPNSLACLSELLSAFEHTGPLSEAEQEQIAVSGATATPNGRRVGLQNLIVGRSNEHLTLTDSYAAYRATGRALAAFVSNPAIRDQFSSYLTANWTVAASRAERLATSNEPAPKAPFSAFGFATVGLGRSLYLEYAAQRLAGAALERVRRGHLQDVAPGTLVDEDRKIAEIVEQRKLSFIESCGLSETRPNANQVLDALRDRPRVEASLKNLGERVGSMFFEKFKEGRAEDMSNGLVGQWTPEADRFAAERSVEARDRAATWVVDVQRRTLQATARAIGDYGLPVAAALVDEAAREAAAAAADFRKSATSRTARFNSAIMEARECFSTLGRKMIGGNNSAVTESVERLVKSADQKGEQSVEFLAAELLESMGRGFFSALKRALQNAATELRELMASRSASAPAATVATWPTESRPAVPTTLLPPSNDVLLVGIDDFPLEFSRVTAAMFDTTPSAALSQAVREIISGSWPRSDSAADAGEQDLLRSDPIWVPETLAGSSLGATTQARISTGMHPLTVLLERARNWVSFRRGPVADYARESLAQYLASDQPSHVARAEAFATKFNQALQLAEPLCRFDATAYAEAHPQGDPSDLTYVVGKIPIGPEHEAFEQVSSDLHARTNSSVGPWFESGSVAQEIEIASFLSSAIGPLSMLSLTEPILSEWTRVHQDHTERIEFWRHRRARPLPSFVPMSPERQVAFLRGWFTGMLLDHVPPYEDYWEEKSLSVWSPEHRHEPDEGWLGFPRYLLGDEAAQELEVPAALLESMSLAMLRFASGDRTELEAYERVIALGTSDDPFTPDGAYSHLNSALRDWIEDGSIADGGPTPCVGLAGPSNGNPDERINAIHVTLDHWLQEMNRIDDMTYDDARSAGFPRIWELSNVALSALVELRAKLGRTSGTRPGPSTGQLRDATTT